MGWVYKRLKKTKANEPGLWPDSKKQEAIMCYLACGNMTQTAAICKVPYETVKFWRKQPWWKEQVDVFYEEDKTELDTKYQKIIRKALAVVEDRLDLGNFQMDQKTGKITRVPVNMADTHRVMKDLVDQQQKLRKDVVAETIALETVNDKLAKLAKHFAEMASGKKQTTTYEAVLEPQGDDKTDEPIPTPTLEVENGS